LGLAWLKKGHQIVFGVRDPNKAEVTAFAAEHPGVVVKSIADAIALSDLILLAIPYEAAKQTLAEAGDLSGKIVIDCTNPIGEGVKLTVGHTSSGAEELAKIAYGGTIVKAFNMPGWEKFANSAYPEYNGLKPIMYVCGDDNAANQQVCQLAEDVGFEGYNWGNLEGARYLEPMAMVWILPIRGQELDPNCAFALLRRNRS